VVAAAARFRTGRRAMQSSAIARLAEALPLPQLLVPAVDGVVDHAAVARLAAAATTRSVGGVGAVAGPAGPP